MSDGEATGSATPSPAAVREAMFMCTAVNPWPSAPAKHDVELIEKTPPGLDGSHVAIQGTDFDFREGATYGVVVVDVARASVPFFTPEQCRVNPHRLHDFYPLLVETVTGQPHAALVRATVVCRFCAASKTIAPEPVASGAQR